MRTKIILLITCVLVLATIYVFVRDEWPFDSGLPINDDKISNFASTIGAIGTITATYFLVVQLQEMQLQRRESYKPILFLHTNEFIAKDKKQEHSVAIPRFYDYRAPDKVILPTLYVENRGVGIARNIRFSWIYDTEDVRKLVDGLYMFPSATQTNNDGHKYLEAGQGVNIMIPKFYMVCCGERCNSPGKERKPELYLKVEFDDLSGSGRQIENFSINVLAWENSVTIYC